jgi:hypothetical protein
MSLRLGVTGIQNTRFARTIRRPFTLFEKVDMALSAASALKNQHFLALLFIPVGLSAHFGFAENNVKSRRRQEASGAFRQYCR